MRVGVVGSRDFAELEEARGWLRIWLYHRAPDNHSARNMAVISGGAPGVDSMAAEVAQATKVNCIVHPADWKAHGKAAGMMRNTLIVRDSDLVIAFWDGKSRGTLDTITKAAQTGKPVWINPHRMEES